MGSVTPPHLSQLLCIRKVIDSNSQEDIQEGVLIDLTLKEKRTKYVYLCISILTVPERIQFPNSVRTMK